jgi:hypothetical protein
VIYGGGFSCLRQADRLVYQRTWFKLTSSWDCAPISQWDTQLYNPLFNEPYLTIT